MKFLAVILVLALRATCEKARYDNYRLYEIKVENKIQLDLIHEIEMYPDGVSLF